MTKKQYLDELKKELNSLNVSDVEEILTEYEEHFTYKIEEGFTEEEIAKKLSSPQEIAKEYAFAGETSNDRNGKSAKLAGLVFLSIPLTLIYIVACASVIVLGCCSIVFLVGGFCLITRLNIAGLLPSLPYFSAFTAGIAAFGLSVLSAIGTLYLFLYVKQWRKSYLRWCKNVANNNRYLGASLHPALSKRISVKLKFITIVSLICFITSFAVSYASMCIIAGSLEPWHIWNWFQ